MKKLMVLLGFLNWGLNGISQNRPKPILLPSHFIDGARFYIKIATTNSDTLLAFGDTGGGFTAIFPDAVAKAGLNDILKTINLGNRSIQYIRFDDLVGDNSIPHMEPTSYLPITESVFLAPDMEMLGDEGSAMLQAVQQDIFLGQHFFMGKAWTFDYLQQKIWVNTPIEKNDLKNKNIQSIGFKNDENGKKLYGHPSMKVLIDGDTLDMLFDTGASFFLSDSGKIRMNTTKSSLAGSFIAKSVYNKWISKHPTWKIFKSTDTNADVIEVPEITIGNYTAGPVLFSVRPDEAWSKNMITSMDKVVKGAIGGSALKYFTVKIDYNNDLIQFYK